MLVLDLVQIRRPPYIILVCWTVLGSDNAWAAELIINCDDLAREVSGKIFSYKGLYSNVFNI